MIPVCVEKSRGCFSFTSSKWVDTIILTGREQPAQLDSGSPHRVSGSSARAWSDTGEEMTDEDEDFSFLAEPFPEALYLGEPLDLRDEGEPLELPRSGEPYRDRQTDQAGATGLQHFGAHRM